MQRILFEVPDEIYFRLDKILQVRGQRKAIYNSLTTQLLGLIESAEDPELLIKAIIAEKVRFVIDD